MSKFWHDLGWLLSGGIEKTIRERNQLRITLADTRTQLETSQRQKKILEEKLQHSLQAQPLPFLMLNTLPKSGSIFLAQSLHRGLDIPVKRISPGYVPIDLADYQRLAEASAGNAIAQAHLDANPTNLRLLARYSPRIVLHLRDPRQALLSWVHHLQYYASQGELLNALVTPQPPAALFEGNLSAQIDWHLAHHFSNLLAWMENWLAHIETQASPTVFVTQFQDLRENAHTTILRILDFYDIPHWRYTSPALPRTRDLHFRKGELEEWREAFNPTQQKIAGEMMSNHRRVHQLYGGNSSSTPRPATTNTTSEVTSRQGSDLLLPAKSA